MHDPGVLASVVAQVAGALAPLEVDGLIDVITQGFASGQQISGGVLDAEEQFSRLLRQRACRGGQHLFGREGQIGAHAAPPITSRVDVLRRRLSTSKASMSSIR